MGMGRNSSRLATKKYEGGGGLWWVCRFLFPGGGWGDLCYIWRPFRIGSYVVVLCHGLYCGHWALLLAFRVRVWGRSRHAHDTLSRFRKWRWKEGGQQGEERTLCGSCITGVGDGGRVC